MKILDISDYNDHINWSHLKDNGVDGVIVKISEGRTLSELHAKHIAGASARGMAWGVYCFSHATTKQRAREEARVVVDTIHALGYGNPQLYIWMDVEAPEMLNLDSDTLTAICSAFISECNAWGYDAGIYASLSTFTDNIDVSQLADYVPYWCAQYNSACDFTDYFPGKRLKCWQKTDSYDIDGCMYDENEWYDEN